ncbi:MAG TPA: glycosyltransferase [Jiangellaceae bacterium]
MTTAYLFALWAGGGNVPPQMALATRLAAAGHEVRVLAPAVLRGQIEAAGLEFEPYRRTPEHDEADPARSLTRDFGYRSPLGAAKATRDHLFVAMAEPVAADVLGVLARRRVDVVVPDYMLMGALLAAEKANVPVAGLIHHTYPFPAPGLPPFGNGWVPRPGLLGAARDAAGRAIFDRVWVRPMLDGLNRARQNLGLEPFAEITDLLAVADRFLVLTSRSFDFPAELPANVRYVGPQMDQRDGTPGWSSPWPDEDSRPLVVVSLSTTYQAQESLIRNAIEAVGRLPVRALVTTGPVDASADQVPPNVHVTRFIPHAHVLPHAAAVITHGGHGTVMAALRHGLPMVCLPMGRDQGDVAARVAWHRAGVRLSARSGATKISTAIEHVLRDPGFTTAARRLATAITEDEAAGSGVSELVGLARRRHNPQVLSDDGRVA